MKIAIATDDGNVSQHFGRCQQYTIVDIEDDKIISKEVIDAPSHQKDYLPEYLSEFKVNMILAGGMGRRAQNLFAEKKIETIIGVSGTIDEVIDSIMTGALEIGESTCSPGHGGHSEGENDHDCKHNS